MCIYICIPRGRVRDFCALYASRAERVKQKEEEEEDEEEDEEDEEEEEEEEERVQTRNMQGCI